MNLLTGSLISIHKWMYYEFLFEDTNSFQGTVKITDPLRDRMKVLQRDTGGISLADNAPPAMVSPALMAVHAASQFGSAQEKPIAH